MKRAIIAAAVLASCTGMVGGPGGAGGGEGGGEATAGGSTAGGATAGGGAAGGSTGGGSTGGGSTAGGSTAGGATAGGSAGGATGFTDGGVGPVQCRADTDCGGARTCTLEAPGGICSCVNVMQCPAGNYDSCLMGACVRACSGPADCSAGMTCLGSGRCALRACDGGTSSCPSPYACGSNGFCGRPSCDGGVGSCAAPLQCNVASSRCLEP